MPPRSPACPRCCAHTFTAMKITLLPTRSFSKAPHPRSRLISAPELFHLLIFRESFTSRVLLCALLLPSRSTPWPWCSQPVSQRDQRLGCRRRRRSEPSPAAPRLLLGPRADFMWWAASFFWPVMPNASSILLCFQPSFLSSSPSDCCAQRFLSALHPG